MPCYSISQAVRVNFQDGSQRVGLSATVEGLKKLRTSLECKKKKQHEEQAALEKQNLDKQAASAQEDAMEVETLESGQAGVRMSLKLSIWNRTRLQIHT